MVSLNREVSSLEVLLATSFYNSFRNNEASAEAHKEIMTELQSMNKTLTQILETLQKG